MNVRKIVLLSLALVALIGLGCRKPTKVVVTKGQRVRIEENLLKDKPTPKVVVDALFGENIRLIGMDLSAEQVKPGEPLTITYYWECLKETPGEWKIFGHFELPGGRRMLLDHTPMGELYPISQWKPGDVVRDIQKITVENEAKPGVGTLWVGVFNEEILRTQGSGDRMKLTNKDKVANDGDNRVRAAQVTVIDKSAVSAAAAPKAAAPLKAWLIQAPIVLDGKLDEPVWGKAIETAPFGLYDGKPGNPAAAATAKVLYDDKNVYFGFHVLDKSIENPKAKRDEEVWTADAIEIYLDANADGKDYVELQFSPKNVIFDALFKEHRMPDWKDARKYDMQGLGSAVLVTGTVNQAGDVDTGYDLEVAVPLAAIPGLVLPLQKDATIRVNFFRIDATDGKVNAMYAFAPTGGDFHDLSKAGSLVFAGAPVDEAKPAPHFQPVNMKHMEKLRAIRKAHPPADRVPTPGKAAPASQGK